jgi:hypothetical protein
MLVCESATLNPSPPLSSSHITRLLTQFFCANTPHAFLTLQHILFFYFLRDTNPSPLRHYYPLSIPHRDCFFSSLAHLPSTPCTSLLGSTTKPHWHSPSCPRKELSLSHVTPLPEVISSSLQLYHQSSDATQHRPTPLINPSRSPDCSPPT